jgi:hypothetical protein
MAVAQIGREAAIPPCCWYITIEPTQDSNKTATTHLKQYSVKQSIPSRHGGWVSESLVMTAQNVTHATTQQGSCPENHTCSQEQPKSHNLPFAFRPKSQAFIFSATAERPIRENTQSTLCLLSLGKLANKLSVTSERVLAAGLSAPKVCQGHYSSSTVHVQQ